MTTTDRRSRTISTKLTERDFALAQARASADGETVSSWIRLILQASLKQSGTETVIAEILAMRSLLINLLVPLHRNGHLSDDQIRSLVQRVDAEKKIWAKDTAGGNKE